MPIFFDDVPSSEPRVGIQVYWVRPGPSVFVRFLGDPQGVWVHWIENRSSPCMGDECVFCHAGTPQRWKGYAPALVWKQKYDEAQRKNVGRWIPVVFEMNESLTQAAGGELRGRIMEVQRRGNRNNGPITARMVEKDLPDELPPCFDVRPVLERLWGIRQRKRPEKNPHIVKFSRKPDDQAGERGTA